MKWAYLSASVCYSAFNLFAVAITPTLYVSSWFVVARTLRDFGLIGSRKCGRYDVPVPCPCPWPCPAAPG